MLELFLPEDVCFGSEDPPSAEVLCPLDILFTVAGLASGVRERVGSESFPNVKVSRLPETAARLSVPLDLPKKVELESCKIQQAKWEYYNATNYKMHAACRSILMKIHIFFPKILNSTKIMELASHYNQKIVWYKILMVLK